jgi:hypothetical protein
MSPSKPRFSQSAGAFHWRSAAAHIWNSRDQAWLIYCKWVLVSPNLLGDLAPVLSRGFFIGVGAAVSDFVARCSTNTAAA